MGQNTTKPKKSPILCESCTNSNSTISNHASLAQTIEQNQDFQFKLFQRLSTSSNLVFSPTSIELALSMAAVGSSGDSLLSFQHVLGFENIQALIEKVKSLQVLLTTNATCICKGVHCSIANRIYQGLENVRAEYTSLMKSHFNSAIQHVIFQADPEARRCEINKWTQEITLSKIKELLPENSITPLTRMVLVNAIYFKGKWKSPFNKFQTTTREFQLAYAEKGKTVNVPFMRLETEFETYSDFDENFMYIQIPFAGKGEYVMEIILPNSFEEFEKRLSFDHFKKSRNNKHQSRLDLSLPRFNIGGNASKSLKRILCELGLEHCFSEDADFSFMDPEKSIRISDVFHKAVIEVNEEGAEASAATGVVMVLECSPLVFECTSPFIFTITHIPTSTILFFGKITDPSKN